MVGNDVVDMGSPDTAPGATHPRFDERVFAPEEIEALRSSPSPRRRRWILWAAKESAFKVARKRDRAVVFSPRRFVVSLAGTHRGTVRHAGDTFDIRVEPGAGAVHVIDVTHRSRSDPASNA